MLVTIDVSNNQTVFGIYAGDRLTHHWRISTNLERTTDEHGAILSTLMHIGANRAFRFVPRASRCHVRCRRSTR